MTPYEKTKAVGRIFAPVHSLLVNEGNPNEMTESEFNMLANNIELTGMTDPILVRKLEEGKYRIVGGHHRWEVAKLLGFEEVPITVIDDPEFDDDQEKFQVLRMNVIRGKISPEKFLKMYQSMSAKYADDILQESFGFADEQEFKKLVGQVKASLPKDMQKEFQEAAKELTTIEGLSKLLNRLFRTYGDTLPFGFMFLDFGKKESVWLRMSNETRKAVLQIGTMCVHEKRSVDAIIGGMIRLMAEGKLSPQVLQLIAHSPEVTIPASVTLPTEELLETQ